MDAQVKDTVVFEALGSQSDEALRGLIERAESLLAAREAERKAQAAAERTQRQAEALAQIRQLAAECGLHVKAKRRARKRGRPRKTDTTG